MESGKLYSVAEAAEHLGGVSKWSIHKWFSEGRLRRTKVGARSMIRECDLQAFLTSCNPEAAENAIGDKRPGLTEVRDDR
jgi:excisionase family DNA binding protein